MILLVGSTWKLAERQYETLFNQQSSLGLTGQQWFWVVGLGIFSVVLSWWLVRRRVRLPIKSAGRRSESSPYRKRDSYIPFLYNSGGVKPLAGAVGVLALARLVQLHGYGCGGNEPMSSLEATEGWVSVANGWYCLVLGLLIAFFTWACNISVLWISAGGSNEPFWLQLKMGGQFFPGIRPGTQTQAFLEKKMSQISRIGAPSELSFGSGNPLDSLPTINGRPSGFIMESYVFLQTLVGLIAQIRVYRLPESYRSFYPTR